MDSVTRPLAELGDRATLVPRGAPGRPVSTPRLADLVGRLRAVGERRGDGGVVLLAPGVFHRAALTCSAHVVAAPLAAHPAVVGRLADLADVDVATNSA